METASTTTRPPPTPNLANAPRPSTKVYTWGRGDLGQLCNGSSSDSNLPSLVGPLEGKDAVLMAGNVYNTAMLTADGELYICGDNDSGQLGCKRREPVTQPQRVAALDVYRLTHVAVGQTHVLACADDGGMLSWGAAEFGQLGRGSQAASSSGSVDQPQPKPVKTAKALSVARLAAGESHSLALSSGGQVYSFGQGTFGALGHGNGRNLETPQMIDRLWHVGVTQVACGENHSAALAVDGRLFMWGRGKYGQLGLGTFKSTSSPEHVRALHGLIGTQVACGGDHTLLLTATGKVFSWGRGSWGQTGLGHTDNVGLPTSVEGALAGRWVVQISGGMRHSLAIERGGDLYAWGNGELGQLGLGDRASQCTPHRVESMPEGAVMYVTAAGDHSIAVVQDVQYTAATMAGSIPVGPRYGRPHGLGCLPLELPNLVEMAAAASAAASALPETSREACPQVGSLARAVEAVFSSAGFLIAGFTLPPGSGGRGTTSAGDIPGHNLDMDAISHVYEYLLKVYSSKVVTALARSCAGLLERIQTLAGTSGDAAWQEDWLQVVLIVIQNPLTNGDAGAALLDRLAALVLSLSSWSLKVLEAWLSGLPSDIFAARIVRPLQRRLSAFAKRGALSPGATDRPKANALLGLLAVVEGANSGPHAKRGGVVRFTEFHNADVSDAADLKDEYFSFMNLRYAEGQRVDVRAKRTVQSLCEVPFILTPEAKSRLLSGEARLQMQHEVTQTRIRALFDGIDPAQVGFLGIRVRRDSLLHDALNQIVAIMHTGAHRLKKPLRVTFISNGMEEEGLDQGGVSKEFFQLLVRAIFDPAFGMFVYDEATREYWFNPISLEALDEFQLVGIVLGLAIYNGIILDVHFPLIVFKKLLHGAPTFEDLKETFPELGAGMQRMLDFDGDVENTFCLTFEVEYDFFGEVQRHELIPGGADMPVTAENRAEYVEAYTKWKLVDSIQPQFDAFANGFHKVCGGPALQMFRHDELELLVCGLPHLDFSALQAGTRYDGGYTAETPIIKDFWQELHALPLEGKKRFLSFATGCDRAPPGGLKALTLVVQRGGPDSDRLPTAHTCFNVLLLPEYASRAKLRDRLLTAIQNAEGFGLQ